MSTKITILDRIGRPLLRLVGVAFLVVVVWFVARIMWDIVEAYDAAVLEGRPVPDMSGGLTGMLSVVMSTLPLLLPIITDQITRHRERMDQQARGLPVDGSGPFPQSPVSSGAEGPRPWQNQQ